MNIGVEQFSSEYWNSHLSEDVFKIVFGMERPSSLERHDYVLAVTDDEGEFSGFVTCKEMDSETIYWQYGGVLPSYAKSVYTMKGYMRLVDWCRTHYKRITTRIENTNIGMLKMAFTVGFVIVGTYNHKGKIYLELVNEFQGG